jgi:hypothetical protein
VLIFVSNNSSGIHYIHLLCLPQVLVNFDFALLILLCSLLQRQGLNIKTCQLYCVGTMSGLQRSGRRLTRKLRVEPLWIVCHRYKSNSQLLQDSQKEYIIKNVSPPISNFLLNQVG